MLESVDRDEAGASVMHTVVRDVSGYTSAITISVVVEGTDS